MVQLFDAHGHCPKTFLHFNAQVGTRVACVTRPEAVSAAGFGGWGRGDILFVFKIVFNGPPCIRWLVIIKYATEKSGVDYTRIFESIDFAVDLGYKGCS